MRQKAQTQSPVPTRAATALLVLGLAETALAVFQWMQLLTLRSGGATVCGVSEHVNCETVWNSPFASAVHHVLGMPVAGLGLVWGLTASALAALYLVWARKRQAVRPAVNGLRLTAAAGVVGTLVFAVASANAGALCPTCLGTYVLVLAFAAVALKGLPGPLAPLAGEWGKALGWSGGIALAAFLALLGPGLATPSASAEGAGSLLPAQAQQGPAAPGSLEEYIDELGPREKQFMATALAAYRASKPQAAFAPARRLYGPKEAPVKMVEWTDSRCPHCKALVEAVAELKRRAPPGSFSLEARQFPLDSACNPKMPPRATDGTNVRCLAAKAQICLEGAEDFWSLRERLFANQVGLTPESVVEIASAGSVPRAQLQACMDSADTQAKLQQDIDYAMKHDLKGTPLVVVNGREAMAFPPFLYALIMTGGNPDAPAFARLPAAPAPEAHEGHEH
ncbi:cupin [Aggregicoccus sp. 17bor-14]|uniref:vitamin K epoxide reductase/DsbA family protein n=1 Tax=Myxococcaceae TaxID=31 RepID=UPI00129CC14B|nr:MULTISPECIES: thioredoxin domain-containing protein [Myxococcaceae]MBF5042461.1 thioredoxin domain-containing protein [Simulacricoccus sp. 17bor-14]MRI88232.1 cupin [Aggregicoccus sp. 17bor-14]